MAGLQNTSDCMILYYKLYYSNQAQVVFNKKIMVNVYGINNNFAPKSINP